MKVHAYVQALINKGLARLPNGPIKEVGFRHGFDPVANKYRLAVTVETEDGRGFMSAVSYEQDGLKTMQEKTIEAIQNLQVPS